MDMLNQVGAIEKPHEPITHNYRSLVNPVLAKQRKRLI